MFDALKAWARNLKRDVVALWLAARDPRTPALAKVLAACVAAYALSPIDLIPDFVPVLGYLDDLMLVPVGLWLAVRMIPPALMDELRICASTRTKPVSTAAAATIVAVWVLALAALGVFAWRRGRIDPIVEAVGR